MNFENGEDHMWLLTRDRTTDHLLLTWKVQDDRGERYSSTIEPTDRNAKDEEMQRNDLLEFCNEMEMEFVQQGFIVTHDEQHEIPLDADVGDFLRIAGLLRIVHPQIPYSSPSMGKLSRTKGHQFERDIAIEMRELGWKDARRHLEYQDQEANGIDLVHTDPFLIQCKRLHNYVPVNTIFEINPDDKEKGMRVLVTKADNQPAMAVMEWEDLKTLLGLAKDHFVH